MIVRMQKQHKYAEQFRKLFFKLCFFPRSNPMELVSVCLQTKYGDYGFCKICHDLSLDPTLYEIHKYALFSKSIFNPLLNGTIHTVQMYSHAASDIVIFLLLGSIQFQKVEKFTKTCSSVILLPICCRIDSMKATSLFREKFSHVSM